MKRITVFADFNFLASPQEVGTLGYEHVRGKDHFVFEYLRDWLKQHGAQSEGRPVRMLTNYDHLTGIEDFTRMGGIRYKSEDSDDFINVGADYLVAPIESLPALAMPAMKLSWRKSETNCLSNVGLTN